MYLQICICLRVIFLTFFLLSKKILSTSTSERIVLNEKQVTHFIYKRHGILQVSFFYNNFNNKVFLNVLVNIY